MYILDFLYNILSETLIEDKCVKLIADHLRSLDVKFPCNHNGS